MSGAISLLQILPILFKTEIYMNKKNNAAEKGAATKKEKNSRAGSNATGSYLSKKSIIIISAVSLVLVAALVIGIVFSVIFSRDIDYLEDNLSLYITLPEKEYKGYTLEVLYDEMRDSDVDRKIMSLRYQKRKGTLHNGGNVINLNQPIDAGDTVKIYYRGYTVDELGNETAFNGGCNFSSTPYSLGIGSLGFIPGFEESIIGVKPADYSKLTVKNTGNVEVGDVIYLSYKAMLPDGSSVSKTAEKIDLSILGIDDEYGAGFKNHFIGKKIGTKMSESVTFEKDGGSAVYFDMTVEYATVGEDNPLTIEAYFPADYGEASLKGKTVFFDVYFEEVVAYDTPEYNEEFITKTLGVSDEALSEYEGNNVVEKHKNMLKAEIEKEYLENKKTLVEEAIWNHLHENVKVKRLPQSQVDEIYYEYYNEIQNTYQTYSQYYDSVDSFAKTYLKITDGTDWKEIIRERAESVVTEKLMFYYIIRKESLVPSDEEFQARYNENVEEFLSYYTDNIYSDELQSIKNEADREKRIAEIKAEMMNYYGEEYFTEMVYYEHCLDGFVSLPNVVKKQ